MLFRNNGDYMGNGLVLPPEYEQEEVQRRLNQMMKRAANKRLVMCCPVHGPLDERDELHVGMATAGNQPPPKYVCQICVRDLKVINTLYPVFAAKDYFFCVVCGERRNMIARFHLTEESVADLTAPKREGNLCCHECARKSYFLCEKCGFLVSAEKAFQKKSDRPMFFCPEHTPITDNLPAKNQ